MKKLLSLVSVFVLALGLIGCGGGGASADGSTKLKYEAEVSFDDKPGYTVMVNNYVDGWTYPAESSAASWSPSEGKKLLKLNVTVKADEEVTVGGRDFSVWYGDTNYANWYADAASVPMEFPEGTVVAAGGEFTGDVLYEVPADADVSMFEFDVYRSNLGRGEEMEVTLGDMM